MLHHQALQECVEETLAPTGNEFSRGATSPNTGNRKRFSRKVRASHEPLATYILWKELGLAAGQAFGAAHCSCRRGEKQQ